jgi:hypothetical protein
MRLADGGSCRLRRSEAHGCHAPSCARVRVAAGAAAGVGTAPKPLPCDTRTHRTRATARHGTAQAARTPLILRLCAFALCCSGTLQLPPAAAKAPSTSLGHTLAFLGAASALRNRSSRRAASSSSKPADLCSGDADSGRLPSYSSRRRILHVDEKLHEA